MSRGKVGKAGGVYAYFAVGGPYGGNVLALRDGTSMKFRSGECRGAYRMESASDMAAGRFDGAECGNVQSVYAEHGLREVMRRWPHIGTTVWVQDNAAEERV